MPGLAAALVIGLTACAPSTTGSVAASGPDDAPAAVEPSPAPEPTKTTPPTASAAPPAEPVTCETLLTPAGELDLAQSNLVLREDSSKESADREIVTDPEYPLLADMLRDGVVCVWMNTGDVMVSIGALEMDPETWETTRTELLGIGYVQDDSVIEGFLDGPDSTEPNYTGRGFAYRDGSVYYSSYAKGLTLTRAFQD